ncbi:hypothetical protein LPJ78_003308, partial [Coemansia sp. RSA 989]
MSNDHITHVFRLTVEAQTVELLGTFEPEHWKPIPMTKQGTTYEVRVLLKPSQKYTYKYKVDGEWMLDPSAETATDEAGIVNNVLSPDVPNDKDEKIAVSDDDSADRRQVAVVEETSESEVPVAEQNKEPAESQNEPAEDKPEAKTEDEQTEAPKVEDAKAEEPVAVEEPKADEPEADVPSAEDTKP